MHLIRMRLGGVPPFTELVEFEFNERVNVFVGPNAVGKSTVLLALAGHLIGREENAKRQLLQGLQVASINATDTVLKQEALDKNIAGTLYPSDDWLSTGYEPIVINISSVRPGLPGIYDFEHIGDYDENTLDVLNKPFSGINLMRALDFLDVLVSPVTEQATIGRQPESSQDYILDNEKSEGLYESLDDIRRNLYEMIELADACCKQICDEVIKDTKPHNYRALSDALMLTQVDNPTMDHVITRPFAGIITNDPPANSDNSPPEAISWSDSYYNDVTAMINSPLYLGHLSSGTEGTLLWVRWLALKMVHHYGFHDGWEKRPAILLIDEIENHLHPTWQRRVIPALLEHFPGLQIFATTHSPFVVAGLKAGQVHLLNRDANGVVTATTNTEDIVGWTADEILRTMMGVDDPTDEATAAAARELRQLRSEGTRADTAEEERRQARIRELRRLVDRDLLAGGPAAAQEELFEQQFAEALEKYRQSRDLGQENG